jgi:hypothetical protein
MGLASDARIDSAGVLAGSFVGEGTARAVHLISSDTAVIAGLARRYRPDLLAGDGLWSELARRRAVALGDGPRRRVDGGRPEIRRALVGSPLGHTEVTAESIVLRGSGCGWRGTQAELVVRDDRTGGDPPLRGPVLGVLLAERGEAPRQRGDRAGAGAGAVGVAHGSPARAHRAGDGFHHRRALPVARMRPLAGPRLEINTSPISTRRTSCPSAPA